MKYYDYVVVGAGIAGCSVAHFLKDDNVLLIDRFDDICSYASGTAGGFLSPLLGKPNKFKDLVNSALSFSIKFYEDLDSSLIVKKGVVRIPKDEEDKKRFEVYKKYIDFDFKEEEGGVFFENGSQVFSYEICKKLIENITTKLNYDIKHIKYHEGYWIINEEIKTEKLILTTGVDTSLIDEDYLKIRGVWGQRIDVSTTTCISKNYHKECSISTSIKTDTQNTNIVSIGATHHRFQVDDELLYKAYKNPNKSNLTNIGYTNELYIKDTEELLSKAFSIIQLKQLKVLKKYVAPRACSLDYFPILGELINSSKTLDMFPYLKNGTKVPQDKFSRHKNLFVMNGVGGRGYVLSPYLAKNLVSYIKGEEDLDEDVRVDRLFKRWVRKLK